MAEQDPSIPENGDKSGVFSFRISEVTKKRLQEAIKSSGKKAEEFLSDAVTRLEQQEHQVDLPQEWRAIEQQIISSLPLLHAAWNQTSTILQQERIEVEKLKSRIQELNLKHAEKLVELEKQEKDKDKKLLEAISAKEDAESKSEYDKTRAEQALSTFNAIKNRAEELEEIIKKQKPIIENYEIILAELEMLKKDSEHKSRVQEHELANEKKRLSLECQEKLLHEKAKHIAENEEYQKKIKELNSQIDTLKKEFSSQIDTLKKENLYLKENEK